MSRVHHLLLPHWFSSYFFNSDLAVICWLTLSLFDLHYKSALCSAVLTDGEKRISFSLAQIYTDVSITVCGARFFSLIQARFSFVTCLDISFV